MSGQVVILAGGRGTRLKERLGDLPKPMIPIGGRPLLEHQLELARRHGFDSALLFVCYQADSIQRYFGDGRRQGLRLDYLVEREPLGTAGAVLAGFDQLAERFLVMYGDTMVNVDLTRLWRAHADGRGDATLLLHPNDHPLDSDLVETDLRSRIVAFHNRPHPPGVWRQNLVNAGLYVLEKRTLAPFRGRVRKNAADLLHSQAPTPGETHPSLDFGKDLFPALLELGAHLVAYHSPEFIKDIGTPERYDRVCAQYAAGIVQRSSLETPQRAVFLDRDGTLVKEAGLHGLARPEELELLPGVAEAVHRLNQAGLRAVVVTNQPVVAKGLCTEAQVQVAHHKLETLLSSGHAFLDRIYWCPHHPEKGFAGERPELKIECDCRKPKTGMIAQAVRDLNIDLGQSWLIGDSTTDLQTARNAGLRSVLVRTGYGGADGKYPAAPDQTFDTLGQAVAFIVGQGH
jgi:histidinol-phosphate phosphatase family protein